MNQIIWILIGAFAASLPLIFIKKYIEKRNFIWILLSILCYSILFFAYLTLLQDKNHNIIIIYPMVKIISLLVILFFGLFFFNEKIDIKIGLGIFFAIVSIFLLSYK